MLHFKFACCCLISPPIYTASRSNTKTPTQHKQQNNKNKTPTSNLLGGTKKSTYLCRVCASIVFRTTISGSLYNNQQLLAEDGGGLDLWRRRKRNLCLQGQSIEGIFIFWTCNFSRDTYATVGVQTLCTPLALLLWTSSTNFALWSNGGAIQIEIQMEEGDYCCTAPGS